jgi:hypothetical protein
MVKPRTIGSGERALKDHGSIDQPEQHSGPEQPEQQDQQQQQQSQLDQVPSAVITAGISVKSKQDMKRVSHKKLLSEEKLKRLKEQHDRRGIVYISRCARCDVITKY